MTIQQGTLTRQTCSTSQCQWVKPVRQTGCSHWCPHSHRFNQTERAGMNGHDRNLLNDVERGSNNVGQSHSLHPCYFVVSLALKPKALPLIHSAQANLDFFTAEATFNLGGFSLLKFYQGTTLNIIVWCSSHRNRSIDTFTKGKTLHRHRQIIIFQPPWKTI